MTNQTPPIAGPTKLLVSGNADGSLVIDISDLDNAAFAVVATLVDRANAEAQQPRTDGGSPALRVVEAGDHDYPYMLSHWLKVRGICDVCLGAKLLQDEPCWCCDGTGRDD